MITTITGDLLDFPQGIDIIAHSCNCRNTMSAGIAKQIKDHYPLAYDADTTANENGTNTLSNSSIYSNDNNKHIICKEYKRYSSGKELIGRNKAFHSRFLQ